MAARRIFVGVQANGLTKLVKDMEAITPKILAETVESLRMAGELIANTARTEASWSQRIPGTIRVTGATPRTITIKAGGADAPHAYTFEAPDGKPVRHPTYGHNPWVEQMPRPFLRPAVESHTDEIAELIVLAIDRALLRSGFH